MLKRIIVSLRQKPKPIRDRIALIGAISFTVIIFMIWLYHAPTRQAAVELQNADSVANQPPGFSELFSAFGEAASSIKEVVETASSTSSSSEEVMVDVEPLKDVATTSQKNTSTTTLLRSISTTSDSLDSLFEFESFEQYHSNDDGNEPLPAKEIRIMSNPSSSTSKSKEETTLQ